MDDGSRDVSESLEMLSRLKAQFVEIAVLSSHYYREREAIEQFLDRRTRSAAKLAQQFDGGVPKLLLGAETAFFVDMAAEPDIRKLCIKNTNCLLVEMPFARWTSIVINEIYRLVTVCSLTPIIAHVERYIDDNVNAEAVRTLVSFGAVIQSNAEFFLTRRTRKQALKMLENGHIHVFGSDCHNLTDRVPNMGELDTLLRRKLPAEFLSELNDFAAHLLKPKRDAGVKLSLIC
jgi:protein-tyrosine phosphatase